MLKIPDGTPMMKYVCFDPAAINDNGTIRIYYGTQYGYEEQDDFNENEKYINEEIEMFGRTKEEILSYPDSIMGPSMVVLEDDMLTVKEEAKHIIPYRVKGTSFERHPFFEGSSMRKVGDNIILSILRGRTRAMLATSDIDKVLYLEEQLFQTIT